MTGWGDDDEEIEADPIARLEVANGLRQIDRVDELATAGMMEGFYLTPSIILELHALAMDGIIETTGAYRTVDKANPILGSKHKPPSFTRVSALVEQMCVYVNDRPAKPFPGGTPSADEISRGLHVASYVLWRLNWIHPFEDGNGRTSRAVCYLLLCIHLRMLLPGEISLSERLRVDARKYYRCLDEADRAHKRREQIRLQQLQEFLRKHLIAQLRSFEPYVRARRAKEKP